MRIRNAAALRLIALIVFAISAGTAAHAFDAEAAAKAVTIVRDKWGVPHIDGPDDPTCVFGLAYAQAEDYFWQIEDVYLMALGRYAEASGKWGLKADMISHNFEIPLRGRQAYDAAPAESRAICDAYTEGLNYYLKHHPENPPRLITKFEGWMVFAYGSFTMIDWVFGRTGADNEDHSKMLEAWRANVGSNLWVLGPSRTKDKTAMLFVNPHQPWFGHGQWWEAHVRSASGWNFTGAMFFGSPFPTIGHNEVLGWTHTANAPDIGDLYEELFDDPAHPLNYKYGEGYRTAEERTEIIKVKTLDGMEERKYTFRKTHHGPIVQEEGKHRYACKIAKVFDGDRIGQGMRMNKAKNFKEWYAALSELNLIMFNAGYADKEGNIFYVYNGAVPERDPKFDWSGKVDGTTPDTEWKGLHTLDEMPQVLNPPSGFLQNCNQSPFTATDMGFPYQKDYPKYMVQEKNYDNRRATMSREHLRNLHDVTFEQWSEAVVDNHFAWPITEFPKFARQYEDLKKRNAELALQVAPYWEFLGKWDGNNSTNCTESTLCFEWYETMYGRGFPSEELRPEYQNDVDLKWKALIEAADSLKKFHGDWKVPYGNVFRMQRHAKVADILTVPFKDNQPSVPCQAGSGAMGTSYNAYFTATNNMRKKRYGVVGGSFMAVYEFGKEKVKAQTLLQFGESSDDKSPHFFDQASLYSEKKFKPGWFYWDEVLANAERTYHPGDETAAKQP